MSALPNDSELDTVLQLGTLRAQAEKVLGGSVANLPLSGLTLEEQKLVWERALAFERGEEKPLRDHLAESQGQEVSCDPGKPVAEQLWSLVWALGRMRIYFDYTGHLSDDEFLELLQREILPKSVLLPAQESFLQFDLDEFPTDEQSDPALLHLQYYADEAFRQKVAEDFPDCPLPPVRPLKSQRDEHLPGP